MAGRKPRKPAQPSRRRNRRAEAAATPWWSLGPPGPDEPPDLFGMGIFDDLLAEIVAERESQISIRKRGRPTKKQKALDEANTLVGVAEGFEGERAREIATKSLGLSPDCALARLDAEDGIVARFMHLDLLISHGRFAAAKQLCDECREEVFCVWPYGRALIAFGEQGDTPAARQLLAEASVVNPHVPRLLLSGREFDPGGMITVGAEDEAAAYVRDFRSCWMDVPGALAWLRACGNVPLENAGRDDRQLALDVLEDRPLPDDLWGMLADAMRRPRHGEPRRPATVAMRPGVLPKTWRRKLEEIGVRQILREELDTIARISSDVAINVHVPARARMQMHVVRVVIERRSEADFGTHRRTILPFAVEACSI